MPISSERRAEINRENARKSTGPKTPEGKAASRRNAVKHGLAARVVGPAEVEKREAGASGGEPAPGASYRERLGEWFEDLRPRNVLERAIIERACRSTWKLDRCVRYEEAAEAVRRERTPEVKEDDPQDKRERARFLGALLMLTYEHPPSPEWPLDPPPPPTRPGEPPHYDPFNDVAGAYSALCSFKEGVEWLLAQWFHYMPGLPAADGTPAEGPEHFLRDCPGRALRLLGLKPERAPSQPIRAAGEAEVRRLEALRLTLIDDPTERLKDDLALFAPGPDAQLLIRYEADAAREFHRAVATFLKLRQSPDLIPSRDAGPEPAGEEKAAAEVGGGEVGGVEAVVSEPAGGAVRARPNRRRGSPPRNEASRLERDRPERAPARVGGEGLKGAKPPG